VSCQLHSNAPIAPDGSLLGATLDGTLPHAVVRMISAAMRTMTQNANIRYSQYATFVSHPGKGIQTSMTSIQVLAIQTTTACYLTCLIMMIYLQEPVKIPHPINRVLAAR